MNMKNNKSMKCDHPSLKLSCSILLLYLNWNQNLILGLNQSLKGQCHENFVLTETMGV